MRAVDAIELITDNMTIDDVVLELERLAKEAFQPAPSAFPEQRQARSHERQDNLESPDLQYQELQELPEAQEA